MKYYEAFAEHGFHTALMTTFRFDAGVFEDVIRSRLRSNGCRNIAVLADTDMLNAAFAETGLPVSAGARYHLAKRSVKGAFHPKMVLQFGKTKGRLIVGSANLTGAGLHGNLEILEVLEVNQNDMTAAPLLAAALAYFASHTDRRDKAMKQALERASRNTDWLQHVRAASRIETPSGFVEFVTESAGATIADRLVDAVGGRRVSRVVCAAPFWDSNLSAVQILQRRLSPEITALVVDPKAQDFDAPGFRALERASLHSAGQLSACEKRRFHAKLIIVETNEGDLVLSGSANISRPALLEVAGNGNAEAAILRWEPPGTAVQRLGIDAALAVNMPLSDLKPRQRAVNEGETKEERLIDGGAVFLDAAALEWQPPGDVDLSSCLIEVFDVARKSLGVGEPVGVGERIWIEGIDDLNAAAAAEALIEDRRSVRMPIVSLSQLKARSNPPSRAGAQKILDEIYAQETIDAELCEQLRRLFELLQENDAPVPTRDGSSSRGDDPQDEDDSRHLDSDAFGEAAQGFSTNAERDVAFRSAYDRIAQILRHLQPRTTQSELSNGGSSSGSKQPAAVHKRSPDQRRDQLSEFLQVILDGLQSGGLEPLSITALTMIQAFITTMRSEAAETDSTAGEAKAFGPNKPGSGWIRMLGRCLQGFVEAIPEALSESDVEDEQIEVLAQILMTAKMVFERAQKDNMPVVCRSMGIVLSKLHHKLGSAISGHRGKETLLIQEITRTARLQEETDSIVTLQAGQ
ncbi:hypothetical protein [Antarcticimicrobium sediminis]|uniref:PLD phosphodiesterase domain-containing protein n=1 Tax=Antarcticimicrobium sediminis TaxID=2546227 RepID=A0A4R5ELU2_9RHOB|nr:hypothetical protein [Antarcticimicrobium sediminis]TDE35639.1 hypothetical protein E1B25_16935 [Antarcticimicrobium sediminis]